MSAEIHVCKPADTTVTLCDKPAARVAAVNFSEFRLVNDPTKLCQVCKLAAEAER